MADLLDGEEDFDLASLPDDELVEQMRDVRYNGVRDEIAEGDAYCRDAGVAVETAKADPAAPRGMTRRTAAEDPGMAPALVVACGAIARELRSVIDANGWRHTQVQCLPADLHNRPERIPEAVREKIQAARGHFFGRIFVAYADCGTGGLLDRVLEDEGVERLPGAHCYEFYAGAQAFAALADAEPGSFYLTDFLVRHFERLVLRELGIERHAELAAQYFGNYRRLVYLAQHEDAQLLGQAREAAARLGLAFEYRYTGYGDLERSLVRFHRGAARNPDAE